MIRLTKRWLATTATRVRGREGKMVKCTRRLGVRRPPRLELDVMAGAVIPFSEGAGIPHHGGRRVGSRVGSFCRERRRR